MRSNLAAIVLVAVAAGSGCRPAPPAYVCKDCNVLLISMDTLRADHVGAYGYQRPTTPTIDGIAARSVVFENAISQSSWTRPAHMSMFTGMYPAEHGYIKLADRKRLADEVPTLARVMGEHGYTTVAFTGGINMSPNFGFDQGFELYRVNGRSYRNSLEEAKYWLDEIGDEKFFLLMHAYDPHTPYHSDLVDREALDLRRAPPGKGFRHACKNKRKVRMQRYVDEYDGAVRRGDRYLGKLLAYMEERGALDNTLVVFTSDHGEEFLEHGRCFHLTSLYREVLHVPLMITGPGIEARRVAGLVPASVSISPTILDLVGITEHDLPGPSLADVVMGATPSFEYVESETFRRIEGGRGEGHVRALTGANEKLIHWVTKDEYDYFDTTRDLAEQRPIADAPRLAALRQKLDAWVELHPPRARHEQLDAAEDKRLEQQLKALGYAD